MRMGVLNGRNVEKQVKSGWSKFNASGKQTDTADSSVNMRLKAST